MVIVLIDKVGKLLKIYCFCIICVCVGGSGGGKGGVFWGDILDFSFLMIIVVFLFFNI